MFLFLDLDDEGYEFFTGKYYASGDVKNVYDGKLAIVDISDSNNVLMMVVDEKLQIDEFEIEHKVRIESWIPVEISTIRMKDLEIERLKRKKLQQERRTHEKNYKSISKYLFSR